MSIIVRLFPCDCAHARDRRCGPVGSHIAATVWPAACRTRPSGAARLKPAAETGNARWREISTNWTTGLTSWACPETGVPLALSGPFAAWVEAAVPVIPGVVPSAARSDDAPPQFQQQFLGGRLRQRVGSARAGCVFLGRVGLVRCSVGTSSLGLLRRGWCRCCRAPRPACFPTWRRYPGSLCARRARCRRGCAR